jgi:hypothetical protein
VGAMVHRAVDGVWVGREDVYMVSVAGGEGVGGGGGVDGS